MELAIEQPAFGQVHVANELSKCGMFVSLTECAAFGYGMTCRPLPRGLELSRQNCRKN